MGRVGDREVECITLMMIRPMGVPPIEGDSNKRGSLTERSSQTRATIKAEWFEIGSS